MKKKIIILMCSMMLLAITICFSGCFNNYGGMTQEEANELNEQMDDELMEEGVVPDQDGEGEPATEITPDK